MKSYCFWNGPQKYCKLTILAQNKLPRIILEPFINTNEWSSHISQKDDSVTLFSDLISHLKAFPVYQSAPAENKPSSSSPVLFLLHHWVSHISLFPSDRETQWLYLS